MSPISRIAMEPREESVRLCCFRRASPNLERYHKVRQKPRKPAARRKRLLRELVVVFLAEVGDQVFAHHPAQGVLEFHGLDEQVVLGIEFGAGHGRLEVETQPLLDAAEAGALRKVEEYHQVEHDRSGQDRVAAE